MRDKNGDYDATLTPLVAIIVIIFSYVTKPLCFMIHFN